MHSGTAFAKILITVTQRRKHVETPIWRIEGLITVPVPLVITWKVDILTSSSSKLVWSSCKVKCWRRRSRTGRGGAP